VLLGVPNFSEGRESRKIEEISGAFATGAAMLDVHSDAVHNRTVITLSAPPGVLATALINGARTCVNRIDMRKHDGAHPCIGALDVCPVVWLHKDDRDAARDAALTAAREIGADLEVPVFLYGDLARHESHRERAFFRAGGLVELTRRPQSGGL
jgi:glutamate formiminotransferase